MMNLPPEVREVWEWFEASKRTGKIVVNFTRGQVTGCSEESHFQVLKPGPVPLRSGESARILEPTSE